MLPLVMFEQLECCASIKHINKRVQADEHVTYVFMTSAWVIEVFCAMSSMLRSSEL
jgi:hypothetical protein